MSVAPPPDKGHWEVVFTPFSQAMMSSPVDGMYIYCTTGWHRDADPAALTAACHTCSAEGTKEWLETAEVQALLDRIVDQDCAATLQAGYIETKVFQEGWCCSVLKTRSDNPTQSKFFAIMQEK